MAENRRLPVTLSVLNSYFSKTADMMAYLSELLEPIDDHGGSISEYLLNSADSSAYVSLIRTTYVASKLSPVDNNGGKRFKFYTPMVYMRDMIDKAQERLFSRHKGSATNIITSGYRLSSRNGDTGKRGMTRMGITNYFVNTIVTALKGPEWETLLQRIGEDAMLHLLLDTSIFVSLPNQCLCQMTGEPLVYIPPPNAGIISRKLPLQEQDKFIDKSTAKRKAPGRHEDEPLNKRLRVYESISSTSTTGATKRATAKSTSQPTHKITPADIPLVRVRLFYSRPIRVPHQNHIAVGLPPKHILNHLVPSYNRKLKIFPEDYVEPDPRIQAEHARRLSKYVFPKQYNLSNVFNQPARWKMGIPDFGDRESEIQAKGLCKTPKRLRDILSLLEKMIWRHGKCGYKPLRDKACPSKIKSEGTEPLDNSVILELMSERSIQLRTQPALADTSMDSAGLSISPHGLSQAEKHTKHKPRFAEFSCSQTQVYCYAILVTKAVIPKAFWGSDKNFNHILGRVKEFIRCRRYETLTLHYILQGFSTSDCEWLMPPGQGGQQQTRVPVTDALKRRELLEEFIFWYFDSFLLPLLKTTFYITETSAFRNQVLYFRHDDWGTLCAPLINRLTSETFEKMPQSEAEELLRQRKLGFSFVRLLPKDTGVRPIVNLRRRKTARNGAYGPTEQSINQILQAAFQILSYERQAHPELLGASVFGANEVYSKLKAFKLRLKDSSSETLPKLYFVKVDVQSCFDTIEQTKLLEILRELISEDAYMTQRHGQVSCTAGKIQRKYVKKALPEDDHPHFLEYAAELASVLRNVIFVDQVTYPFSKKQEILHLLEEHITENIVKIGDDYYRQIVGIPQGSVLSALLCCFFYGDLEKQFSEFREDPQSELFRIIDDYLFITTSLSRARKFLDMMNRGHPDYGCFISKDKTMTNFDYDDQVMNVIEPCQRVPWCGFLINMTDLSVSSDYSKFHGNRLQDSLTVNRGRRSGVAFLYKMLQQTKLRSQSIYYDSNLNSDDTVYLNIYQNFLLAAMKMHQYIRNWGISVRKSSKFIQNTVRRLVLYTYATIRNKISNKVARASFATCNVQKAHVMWLGFHAFHTVLSRKAPSYVELLKHLTFELSLAHHRRSRKRFRALVKEGLVSMAQISF